MVSLQKIMASPWVIVGVALFAALFMVSLMTKPAAAQTSGCTYVDDNGLISGLTVQKRQVSTQVDDQYSSNAWVNVSCGSPHQFSGSLPVLMLDGKLLPGQSATVTVNAEGNILCKGTPSNSNQFCSARILLNGSDIAPDPDNFHWAPVTNNDNWGNYGFSRSKKIECPLTLENIINLGCTIGQVELQVRTNAGALLRTDSVQVEAILHPQTLIL